MVISDILSYKTIMVELKNNCPGFIPDGAFLNNYLESIFIWLGCHCAPIKQKVKYLRNYLFQFSDEFKKVLIFRETKLLLGLLIIQKNKPRKAWWVKTVIIRETKNTLSSFKVLIFSSEKLFGYVLNCGVKSSELQGIYRNERVQF